jgi:hypothetical protein
MIENKLTRFCCKIHAEQALKESILRFLPREPLITTNVQLTLNEINKPVIRNKREVPRLKNLFLSSSSITESDIQKISHHSFQALPLSKGNKSDG